MADTHRSLTVTRTGPGVFLARGANGTEVAFGAGGLSPVEMLMAALAGCSAMDVDVATARHADPDRFEVRVDAEKLTDGFNRLEDIVVSFDVAFPEGKGGDVARTLLPRVLQVTHDRSCTVSATIEAATPVTMRVV